MKMLDLVQLHRAQHLELMNAIESCMSAGRFIVGSEQIEFERIWAEYCGRLDSVCVSSGTAALHLMMLAHSIGAGDEVITVPNSFIATAEAIVHAGAKPVFCDVDPRTLLMDLSLIPRLVTNATKAIVPVHLFGDVVDVVRLRKCLRDIKREDILILEDCAHASGASLDGRRVPLGDAGAFSFNPVKNLGGITDGGAVVTDRPDVAARLRSLRDHGRVAKDEHVAVGFNLRPSHVNCAVLEVKLRELGKRNDRRREIAATYDQAFSAFATVGVRPVDPRSETARHLYVILVGDRDQIRKSLGAAGVPTAIHYPTPIPDQLAMRAIRVDAHCPVSSAAAQRILTLPCHPAMTDDEVERVIASVGQATAAYQGMPA